MHREIVILSAAKDLVRSPPRPRVFVVPVILSAAKNLAHQQVADNPLTF